MNDEEKNIDEALSNFFENDFLEINIENDKENIVKEEITDNVSTIETKDEYNDDLKLNDNKTFDETLVSNNYSGVNDVEKDSAINEYQENDETVAINTIENEVDARNDNEQKDNNDSDKKNTNYKKILLCFLAGFIIGGIIIFLIVNYVSNVERKTNCSFEAKDNNFKNTDEYIITYKGNKINYVEGIYTYTALTDDFKPQIEYIKEEKLPVIINSNGMPGFTHIYEISDNYLKIFSYYDVMLFDFNIVDKNDDKAVPISYINLKSDVTYKKLIKSLEKNGYKCTQSK